MENGRKKDFKTKQVNINSLDFLDCVLANKETKYPVTICIITKDGGCSWSIEDRESLLKLYKCVDVYRGNIIRASHTRGETYIEISHNGRFTIQKEDFPKIEHMKELSLNDVQDIYDSIYHKESYDKRIETEKQRLKEEKERLSDLEASEESFL